MYKDDLVKSKRIEGIEDTEIKVRGTLPRRVAKTERLPVWIVEIMMPRMHPFSGLTSSRFWPWDPHFGSCWTHF